MDIEAFMKKDLFAGYVGIELLSAGKGNAVAKMELKKCHRNGAGMVHGGAIFTLADLAFAAAANSHDYLAVAMNVSISFMNSTKGATLFAEASEISQNKRVASYTVIVKDETNETIALFQGLAYKKG